MSSDIVAAQISTKPISFSRERAGWIWREDRCCCSVGYCNVLLFIIRAEQLGNYQADFYTVNGMVLESRKRREHLSEEDLQKNRAIMESFSKGGPGAGPAVLDTEQVTIQSSSTEVHHRPSDQVEVPRRPSLAPPPAPGLSWSEYCAAPAGSPPVLGRRVVAKQSSKQFKATIAMSEQFPMKVSNILVVVTALLVMQVDMLLAVLEVIAPQFKHFNKLRDFVKLKLPPGFPIQVNSEGQ